MRVQQGVGGGAGTAGAVVWTRTWECKQSSQHLAPQGRIAARDWKAQAGAVAQLTRVGQFIHPSPHRQECIPSLVTALADQWITAISAGERHTLFLSDKVHAFPQRGHLPVHRTDALPLNHGVRMWCGPPATTTVANSAKATSSP